MDKNLAPQVGLEPTTLRLTAECSTIELLRSNARIGRFYYSKALRPVSTVLRSARSHGTLRNISVQRLSHEQNRDEYGVRRIL